jgi:alkaline phosphatase
MGSGYGNTPRLFRSVAGIRASTGEMLRQLQRRQSITEQAAWLKEATDYEVPARRMETLAPFLGNSGYALYDGYRSGVAALAQVLANHTGISFTSTAHTSDLVPILAVGPGAGAFRGFLECTEVFDHYVQFAGPKFRNPQEDLVASVDAAPRNDLENVGEYLLG